MKLSMDENLGTLLGLRLVILRFLLLAMSNTIKTLNYFNKKPKLLLSQQFCLLLCFQRLIKFQSQKGKKKKINQVKKTQGKNTRIKTRSNQK